jgi:hypothetical protein
LKPLASAACLSRNAQPAVDPVPGRCRQPTAFRAGDDDDQHTVVGIDMAFDPIPDAVSVESRVHKPGRLEIMPPVAAALDCRVSEIFKTSRTAAAIRLVQLSQRPLCLVSHTRNGRRWFARSQALSGNWIPSRELRSESAAFAMIFGKGVSKTAPRCINASIWFTRRDASRFNVLEESFRVQGNEVISLLSMKEEKEFLRQQS